MMISSKKEAGKRQLKYTTLLNFQKVMISCISFAQVCQGLHACTFKSNHIGPCEAEYMKYVTALWLKTNKVNVQLCINLLKTFDNMYPRLLQCFCQCKQIFCLCSGMMDNVRKWMWEESTNRRPLLYVIYMKLTPCLRNHICI